MVDSVWGDEEFIIFTFDLIENYHFHNIVLIQTWLQTFLGFTDII